MAESIPLEESRQRISKILHLIVSPLFQDPLGHLCDLIDFATEMTVKLEEINKHSFNNFQLRIGVAVGALGTSRASCVFIFLKRFFMNLKGPSGHTRMDRIVLLERPRLDNSHIF
jgi:hypothetical protein